jgi:hypothetical protein
LKNHEKPEFADAPAKDYTLQRREDLENLCKKRDAELLHGCLLAPRQRRLCREKKHRKAFCGDTAESRPLQDPKDTFRIAWINLSLKERVSA